MSGRPARMQVAVSDDRQVTTLTLLPESGLEGEVPLTLDQLGQLIAILGQARAAMVDKRDETDMFTPRPARSVP